MVLFLHHLTSALPRATSCQPFFLQYFFSSTFFLGLDDTNVRSFVRVPQVPETLWIFFSVYFLSLVQTGYFLLFSLSSMPSTLLWSPTTELFILIIMFSVLKVLLGSPLCIISFWGNYLLRHSNFFMCSKHVGNNSLENFYHGSLNIFAT